MFSQHSRAPERRRKDVKSSLNKLIYMMNKDSIVFNFSKQDSQLFDVRQREDWIHIEKFYKKIQKYCLAKVIIPTTGSHKEWITARVKLHVSTSIMRLLYLTESFCDTSKTFNSAGSAVLIKAMVEIPLHLGYLTWILDEHSDFDSIKKELSKIAFGRRDQKGGLTKSSKITQKDFYTRADGLIKKFFKDQPSTINIFETLYKEANATGHHNYEGRNMLCGLENNGIWQAKDRKELFVFYSTKIFQFFMHCNAILGMSFVFLEAIDHYLKQLPDYYR